MADDLDDWERRGLGRSRRPILSAQGPRVRLRKRQLIHFGSNDYLSLAADPRLARAAGRAARRYGCGAGASPLVTGHLPPLRRLEKALAAFEGEESALVFSSGFAANLGVIAALVGAGDAVFSDQLNHASLIDGCRLSGAVIHVYEHRNVGHLGELLTRHGPYARRRLIVTDSLFSMDGDFAPLLDLADLAKRHDGLLLVDEAHATGVFGPTGRGLVESLNHSPLTTHHSPATIHSRLIKTGTLSKALGAQGGFVCGPRLLCDWLLHSARPYVYSTALAPPICAAAGAALRIVASEPQRRHHVLSLAPQLRQALQERGFDTGASQSQIVPILVGDPEEAAALSRRLEDRGYLAPAIRPPSVSAGTSRLRVSVTAGHSEDDIHGFVEALTTCRSNRKVPSAK